MGRHEDAIKLGEEAVEVSKKVIGAEQSETIWAIQHLADSYFAASRFNEALELREAAFKVRQKVNGVDHPDTVLTRSQLAETSLAVGLSADAIALWEAVLAKDKDAQVGLKLGSLQAWLGGETNYAATCAEMLKAAADETDRESAEFVAWLVSLRPVTGAELQTNLLALATNGVQSGKDKTKLALGMAEFRNGLYPAAEQHLSEAEQAFPNNRDLLTAARLYRAMTVFRENHRDEARKILNAAQAQMRPLPKDENQPLAGVQTTAQHEVMTAWLAFKEASLLLR